MEEIRAKIIPEICVGISLVKRMFQKGEEGVRRPGAENVCSILEELEEIWGDGSNEE